MRRSLPCLLAILCLVITGCEKPTPPTAPAKPSRAASKLTVLVVDDPGIAAGLKLLRGEWLERSGGELDVGQTTIETFIDGEQPNVDVIIFPSRHIGSLVIHDCLREVRKSVLESEEVAFGEIYPAIRDNVLRYGSQTYALTLGDAPLMLVAKKNPGPPLSGDQAIPQTSTSWSDVSLDWIPQNTSNDASIVAPKAIELIVRAIACSQDRMLFDPITMEPLIAKEPYQRALLEVLKGPEPRAVFDLALGWPEPLQDEQLDEKNTILFSRLPNAKQVYDPTREMWIDNESTESLAVLGLAGRSIGVSKATRNASSAFKLLKWLVSDEIASQLSPRSSATLWFRKTQESRSKRWLANRDANDDVAAEISTLLSSRNVFLIPRIPGIDEYLAVMEKSIDFMAPTDRSVDETLADIAAKWNKITERYGRDQQRAAYRRHLGLGETAE